MAKKCAAEFLPPNWDEWAPRTTVGNCVIEITHDQTPSRAISVLAHPVSGHKDSGAFIHYYPGDKLITSIGISDAAYWSSRRKGQARAYFSREGHPKITLSVLQALDSGDLRDRIRALQYLFLTPSGYTPVPGEGVFPLIKDPKGFTKVADKWIAARSQSLEGLKEITSARKLMEDAKRYNESLTTYEALRAPNQSIANLTQSSILLAVSSASKHVKGIPRIRDVRDRYRDIGIKYDREKESNPHDGGAAAKPLNKKRELRLGGFDTALKNLGFSWLPKSWPSQ